MLNLKEKPIWMIWLYIVDAPRSLNWRLEDGSEMCVLKMLSKKNCLRNRLVCFQVSQFLLLKTEEDWSTMMEKQVTCIFWGRRWGRNAGLGSGLKFKSGWKTEPWLWLWWGKKCWWLCFISRQPWVQTFFSFAVVHQKLFQLLPTCKQLK